ncbi:MAG: hypothetical protein ACRDLF_02210 [Solirubrobacteraceae bacterium]
MSGLAMPRRALCAVLVAMLWAAPPALARWSAPARLEGCAVALLPAVPPLIVFPTSDPLTRSGPGALLWSAPRGCAGRGGGAAPAEVLGAALAADDLPEPARPLSKTGVGDLSEVSAATGTAAGQVVVSGLARPDPLRGPGAADTGALAEGWTVGAFAPARPLGGPAAPVAVSSAYLGDAVLASPVRTRRGGWEIAVRVQRHYSSELGPPRLVPVGPGPPTAVAAAMDYRADILLVWAGGGVVYARVIAQSGAIEPVRRLGRIGTRPPAPEIRALLSDDGHAIVAWRSQTVVPGGGARTTIELSFFETGLGAASSARASLRVERFRDPHGWVPPPGSLRLIRLSSEAVMMAWTGIDAGRYVVRASPVSLHRGVWAPVVISGSAAEAAARSGAAPRAAQVPGSVSAGGSAPAPNAAPAGTGDAVLADLVPGPHAEALALWSAAPRLPGGGSGRASPDPWALLAARGHYAGRGEVAFEAPETVAPPGPNGPPAAAFDPQTGQALAAWVVSAGGPSRPGGNRIAYALRAAGAEPAPPPAVAYAARAHAAASGSRLAVALAVLVLLLLAAAAVFPRGAVRRPRRLRARRG